MKQLIRHQRLLMQGLLLVSLASSISFKAADENTREMASLDVAELSDGDAGNEIVPAQPRQEARVENGRITAQPEAAAPAPAPVKAKASPKIDMPIPKQIPFVLNGKTFLVRSYRLVDGSQRIVVHDFSEKVQAAINAKAQHTLDLTEYYIADYTYTDPKDQTSDDKLVEKAAKLVPRALIGEIKSKPTVARINAPPVPPENTRGIEVRKAERVPAPAPPSATVPRQSPPDVRTKGAKVASEIASNGDEDGDEEETPAPKAKKEQARRQKALRERRNKKDNDEDDSKGNYGSALNKALESCSGKHDLDLSRCLVPRLLNAINARVRSDQPGHDSVLAFFKNEIRPGLIDGLKQLIYDVDERKFDTESRYYSTARSLISKLLEKTPDEYRDLVIEVEKTLKSGISQAVTKEARKYQPRDGDSRENIRKLNDQGDREAANEMYKRLSTFDGLVSAYKGFANAEAYDLRESLRDSANPNLSERLMADFQKTIQNDLRALSQGKLPSSTVSNQPTRQNQNNQFNNQNRQGIRLQPNAALGSRNGAIIGDSSNVRNGVNTQMWNQGAVRYNQNGQRIN